MIRPVFIPHIFFIQGVSGMFSFIGRLESLLRGVAACSLVAMALLTGADVFMRGVFNSPLIGVEEVVALLAVLTTGLALAYTHSQRSNIGVEFLVSRLSRKTRARLHCLTDLASAVLFAVVTWRMVLYGNSMAKVGHVSMTLELPTHMIIYTLAVGFACLALVQLKDFMAFFAGGR